MNTKLAADTLLFNGTIVSMDNKKSTYEAIAIKNGMVFALGTNDEILPLSGTATQVIDLRGRTALPGLIDSHQHFFLTGYTFIHVDCALDSIEEVVKAIRKKAEIAGPDDWIIGAGYYEAKFKEGRNICASDFAGITQPVFITRYCNHTAVVNERVLHMMGINLDTVIADGVIERDETGKATGILQEKAMEAAKKLLPAYTEKSLMQAAKEANDYYIRNGVTSVHEAGMGFCTGSLLEFAVLQKMVHNNELDVRIYAMILDAFFEQANAMQLHTGFGDDQLKVGGIKIFYDGTMGGQTAYVSMPFRNSPENYGLTMISKQALNHKILEAHKKGYQIAIHAMGDKGIADVLSAYENAIEQFQRDNHRHRIEHASVMNLSLIKRMADKDIIPAPTIPLVYTAGDTYLDTLHPDLVHHVYPNKTYFEYNMKPAANSDSPITPTSPFLGMYTAMSRKTKSGQVLSPNEAITLYEALAMYTTNAAYASFDEKRKGTLEVGKLGDITIVPQGFLHFTAEEVRDTEVEITMIGGKIVYQKENKGSFPCTACN